MRAVHVGLLPLALLCTPLRAQDVHGYHENGTQHGAWEWAGAFDLHSLKPYTLSFAPNLAHMGLLLVPSTTADTDGIEEVDGTASGSRWAVEDRDYAQPRSILPQT